MDEAGFLALAAPALRGLRAYDPGLDLVALRRAHPGLVELGSNENALGPGPAAREAAKAALATMQVYPDPAGGELKAALAAHHGVGTGQLMLGNGSHELLMMLAQAFAGPGRDVLASEFGFAVYALAAQAAGARLVQAPARPGDDPMPLGHDLQALAAAVGPATRLVYLANPNNPTGTWFPTGALAAFLEGLPGDVITVVDEAYLEYVADPALTSAVGLLGRFPRLVVTRTFSKAHGLAGLRIGYLLAHPGLVAVLERLRESFNANAVALAAAQAALGDRAHLERVRRENAAEREALADALRARGLAVFPSQTNFLLVGFGRDAAPVAEGLVARGVVPRPMGGYGLPQHLRITVGTRDLNGRFLRALDEVLA